MAPNTLPKQSKAARVRVVRTMLPILYARLQDALRKRRQKPVEFKVTVSHKHAKVKVKPLMPEIMDDREVRDAVKRMETLLARNNAAGKKP